MPHRKIFMTEGEAWDFAKGVVKDGGTVLDYGVADGGYYIEYTSKTEA